MEDLVAKLTDRLDAMNAEFKDSFSNIVDSLKEQGDKIEFVRQKTDLLENSLQNMRVDAAENKGDFHTAPASPTELIDKGDGILPRPPPPVLPKLALGPLADPRRGQELDASGGGERRGWVPKWTSPSLTVPSQKSG